jgi:RNA polymerase sigma-70 factor (ECF subfamily)
VGDLPVIDSPGRRHLIVQVPSSASSPADVSSPAARALPERDPRTELLRSSSVDERDEAWRELYDGEFERVYRLACRFGVPLAEVEDVAQQVFLVAYRRMTGGEAVQNVRAWLRGVTVKVVADHHRWRRVRRLKHWLVEAIYDDAGAEPAASPAVQIEQARRIAEVGEVLRRLSPKLRSVLVLSDIEECSLAEVAEAVGAPINTVRSRRRLAREAFQREWERRRGKP